MILLLASLLFLLLLGIPVFAALGISSAVYMLAYDIQPLIAVQQMFAGIDQFPLLAVPFFVLAGNLMNASEITDRIYRFATTVFGRFRGGLGHVNVFGTAVADASGLGTIEIKAMREEGYDTPFAVGLTAASATLGPLIPPSLAMVIYGSVASVSVGQLFAAGIVPGLLLALSFHAIVHVLSVRRGYPRSEACSVREVGVALGRAIPALFTPAIIIGGLMAGVFTPTEAAVVAALYALTLDLLLYRNMDYRTIIRVLFDTFETTAVIMVMVACSVVFGAILVREQVAQDFTRLLLQIASEPWQVMLALNVMLLFAGMFLDTIAIILIVTPVILPALQASGIDLVQFGVVMVLNLMIGLITPPVGLLLFVLARIARLDFAATVRACMPFIVPMLLVLLLVALVPSVSLFLPEIVYRN
ncbi:MAG: TRAP transporter large permease [Cyanobacteria bacterium K_DeepCast_35m_m2_023]|nr:TRAP transporter large permease [Cyanobacteria bacterium K_DeepCast_35m_m2_023]